MPRKPLDRRRAERKSAGIMKSSRLRERAEEQIVRNPVVNGFVGTHGVVFLNVSGDADAKFLGIPVFVDVDLFLLQLPEPPFDHDVVRPPFPTVHALGDMVG